MRCTEARLEAAGERLIGEQGIEVHRRFGNADAVPLGRYAAMQVGQGFGIIEPAAFGHEGFDQPQDTVGAIGEAVKDFLGIDA